MRKSLAVVGTGVVGVGALAFPMAASADVADCGAAPAGATLTEVDGYCQLEFSVAGSYSFTVPSGATDLAAILAGAGGGAEANGSFGYAGQGGSVRYVDLTAGPAAEMAITVEVGAGGSTGDAPTAGGYSSIMAGPDTFTAAGGAAGERYVYSYCVLMGSGSTYLGEGIGAGGPPSAPDGADCAGPGPALNPSVDALDNYSAPVPAPFVGFARDFGAGGYLVASPAPSPLSQGIGQGGSIEMDVPNRVVASSLDGSDGAVFFRWVHAAPTPTPTPPSDPTSTSTPPSDPTSIPVPDTTTSKLPETGQNPAELASVAGGVTALLFAGATFVAFATRARTRKQ